MNPKQRREIKDWYTDLALGRTIKAEDIERPADELARREQAAGVAGCPSCGFSFRLTSTASLEKGECAKCGADWPLHGKREQAQAAQHTPESRSASVAAFDGLAQTADEAFALISSLAAEVERLRSLLAECVSVAEAAMNGRRITVPMCDILNAAKEATE